MTNQLRQAPLYMAMLEGWGAVYPNKNNEAVAYHHRLSVSNINALQEEMYSQPSGYTRNVALASGQSIISLATLVQTLPVDRDREHAYTTQEIHCPTVNNSIH